MENIFFKELKNGVEEGTVTFFPGDELDRSFSQFNWVNINKGFHDLMPEIRERSKMETQKAAIKGAMDLHCQEIAPKKGSSGKRGKRKKNGSNNDGRFHPFSWDGIYNPGERFCSCISLIQLFISSERFLRSFEEALESYNTSPLYLIVQYMLEKNGHVPPEDDEWFEMWCVTNRDNVDTEDKEVMEYLQEVHGHTIGDKVEDTDEMVESVKRRLVLGWLITNLDLYVLPEKNAKALHEVFCANKLKIGVKPRFERNQQKFKKSLQENKLLTKEHCKVLWDINNQRASGKNDFGGRKDILLALYLIMEAFPRLFCGYQEEDLPFLSKMVVSSASGNFNLDLVRMGKKPLFIASMPIPREQQNTEGLNKELYLCTSSECHCVHDVDLYAIFNVEEKMHFNASNNVNSVDGEPLEFKGLPSRDLGGEWFVVYVMDFQRGGSPYHSLFAYLDDKRVDEVSFFVPETLRSGRNSYRLIGIVVHELLSDRTDLSHFYTVCRNGREGRKFWKKYDNDVVKEFPKYKYGRDETKEWFCMKSKMKSDANVDIPTLLYYEKVLV